MEESYSSILHTIIAFRDRTEALQARADSRAAHYGIEPKISDRRVRFQLCLYGYMSV